MKTQVEVKTRTVLLGLIARCEKATGSDRKLDGAIAKALGLPHGKASGFCNAENGDYWVINECAAPFTASLDAAITLVPEGHCGQVQFGKHPGAWVAPLDEEQPADFNMTATPALGLCAAALRAKADRNPKGGDAQQAPSRREGNND